MTHTSNTRSQSHETGPDIEPSGEKDQGKRKRGKPRNNRRRDTIAETKRARMIWKEAKWAAQNRVIGKCHQ
jgi:hypothetical protein